MTASPVSPASTLSTLLSMELARATVQLVIVSPVPIIRAALFVIPLFQMLITNVSTAPSVIVFNAVPILPAHNASQVSQSWEIVPIIIASLASTSTAVPVPQQTCVLPALQGSPLSVAPPVPMQLAFSAASSAVPLAARSISVLAAPMEHSIQITVNAYSLAPFPDAHPVQITMSAVNATLVSLFPITAVSPAPLKVAPYVIQPTCALIVPLIFNSSTTVASFAVS